MEPADDFSRANPPCNAALLDYLTHEFVAHEFDMKWLHREIVLSRTYQLSCNPNKTNALDTRNFARAVPRRLPAEVAYNAITQATARSTDLAVLTQDPNLLTTGSNFDPSNKQKERAKYALAVFGKPTRLTTCDCERSSEPTLLQTLYLQNDNEMLGMIERDDGWLKELIDLQRRSQLTGQLNNVEARIAKAEQEADALRQQIAWAGFSEDLETIEQLKRSQNGQENALRNLRNQRTRLTDELKKIPGNTPVLEQEQIVQQAYLRTVCRFPSEQEQSKAIEYLATSSDRRIGIRDLIWALVNTKEFILNH